MRGARLRRGRVSEYHFIITKPNGDLCIDRIENCIGDDQALRVARAMVAPMTDEYRVEIWRGDECIYDAMPTRWPFQRTNVVSIPLRPLPEDDVPPPPQAA